MKEFNLGKALAGEPILTRDHQKGYVKFTIEENSKIKKLVGIVHNGCLTEVEEWLQSGNVLSDDITPNDIIGMWEEPRPTVTLTLPCPLNEPQEGMWFIEDINSENPIGKSEYTRNNHVHWMKINHCYLYSGVYFSSKEDAQAWLDALKNSRR